MQHVRPKMWKSGAWALLHDNAPAHSSIIVAQFLAEKKKSYRTSLFTPSYPPDLSPADYFLFLKLKVVLKTTRFEYMADIKKNVTVMLPLDFSEEFSKVFDSFY